MIRNLKYRLRSAWKLLTTKRYVFIWVEPDEEIEERIEWDFDNLQPEEVSVFCDIVAEESDDLVDQYYEDQNAEYIKNSLINMIGLN